MRLNRAITLFVAGVLAVLLVLALCRAPGLPPPDMTLQEIWLLSDFAVVKARYYEHEPLAFPVGDIRDFYRWLAFPPNKDAISESIPADYKDAAKGVFVDHRGQPLVYRFPPSREGLLFELYGVGLNGVDEGGGGDDVTWPEPSRFRSMTYLELEILSDLAAQRALRHEARPLAFPVGNIGDFYMWLSAKRDGDIVSKRIPSHFMDASRGIFVDQRGQPLVYRFPSHDRNLMFDLYSVGENGLDDGGKGDDIVCPGPAQFSKWVSEYHGGNVDIDWVRAHLHNLSRHPDDNKMIAAP